MVTVTGDDEDGRGGDAKAFVAADDEA